MFFFSLRCRTLENYRDDFNQIMIKPNRLKRNLVSVGWPQYIREFMEKRRHTIDVIFYWCFVFSYCSWKTINQFSFVGISNENNKKVRAKSNQSENVISDFILRGYSIFSWVLPEVPNDVRDTLKKTKVKERGISTAILDLNVFVKNEELKRILLSVCFKW